MTIHLSNPDDMNKAVTNLQRYVESGRAKAASVIEHVQANVPKDTLAAARAVSFAPTERGDILLSLPSREPLALTQHALAQAAGRVGFPGSTARDVVADYGRVGADAISYTLSRLWEERARRDGEDANRRFQSGQIPQPERVLLRSVAGRYHAVLSDRFRRLDSRPMLDAFTAACSSIGAVPADGTVTDTRISLRAIVPEVITTANDAFVLGASFTNSDFGAGALSVAMFYVRLLCTNGMIGETVQRKAHLGARLADDITYSEKTYRLDAAAYASAVKDMTTAVLGPEAREAARSAAVRAAETTIDLKARLNGLKKSLTKAEIADVTAALQSTDVEEMPMGGPTVYRLANAIAWTANKVADGDRRIELQRLAGAELFSEVAA